MSKREKIILVAMAVAILYGVYSLFFESTQKNKQAGKEKSLAEINRFVADVSAKLAHKDFQKHGYVLAQAKMDWDNDPLFETRVPVEETVVLQEVETEEKSEETFSYSGYIQMGDRTIAIIDGLEYELGDELASGGHIVKMIDPRPCHRNRPLSGAIECSAAYCVK